MNKIFEQKKMNKQNDQNIWNQNFEQHKTNNPNDFDRFELVLTDLKLLWPKTHQNRKQSQQLVTDSNTPYRLNKQLVVKSTAQEMRATLNHVRLSHRIFKENKIK